MDWVVALALYALVIAGWWKIFEKAGEEGWKAIVPIWNVIVLLRIVGREWWWVLLALIPLVGFVIWIIVALDLAKRFGRGTGFATGLVFLPFVFALILGFGSATYRGAQTEAVGA
jgi:hypothetical protein